MVISENKKVQMILTNCGPSCGVPEYTRDLSKYLNCNLVMNIEELKQQKEMDYIIFQCCMDTLEGKVNHAEFLDEIATLCIERNIKFSIVLHVVPFFENMKPATKYFLKKACFFSQCIIVHSELSKVQLNKLGIKNVKIIPHGCQNFIGDEFKKKVFDENNKPILSSFGGMRHEKGFVNILKAAKKIDSKFMLLSRLNRNSESAAAEYTRLLDEAKGYEENFSINTKSLEINDVLKKLKMSDVIIFAYPEETQYSATSGAIRQALCTGVPILCTDAPRFSDLNDEVIKIKPSVDGIIEGLNTVINNENLRRNLFDSTKKFVEKNSWKNISEMYIEVIESTSNEELLV